jgi:protein-tyrosine phosphatase
MPEEERDLDLSEEGTESKAQRLDFWVFPIPDREVPASEGALFEMVERLDSALSSGKNVVIHCRQGVGRTGLVAACLLVSKGVAPDAAVQGLSAARGVTVPETVGQRQWIDHFAEASAHAK